MEVISCSHVEKQCIMCIMCMRCRYDAADQVFVCRLPDSSRPEFYLHPAVVRRNDTSAKSINEWTGEKMLRCFVMRTPVKQGLHVCAVIPAATLPMLPFLSKKRACRDADVTEDVEPESVQPLGNYAVQITWKDGFNQVICLNLLLPKDREQEVCMTLLGKAVSSLAECMLCCVLVPCHARTCFHPQYQSRGTQCVLRKSQCRVCNVAAETRGK